MNAGTTSEASYQREAGLANAAQRDASPVEQRMREREKLQAELRAAIKHLEHRLRPVLEPSPDDRPLGGAELGKAPIPQRPTLITVAMEQDNGELCILIGEITRLDSRLLL